MLIFIRAISVEQLETKAPLQVGLKRMGIMTVVLGQEQTKGPVGIQKPTHTWGQTHILDICDKLAHRTVMVGREKRRHLQNVLGQWISIWEKMTYGPHLMPYTTINSRWLVSLNLKDKTIKAVRI